MLLLHRVVTEPDIRCVMQYARIKPKNNPSPCLYTISSTTSQALYETDQATPVYQTIINSVLRQSALQFRVILYLFHFLVGRRTRPIHRRILADNFCEEIHEFQRCSFYIVLVTISNSGRLFIKPCQKLHRFYRCLAFVKYE